MRARSLSGYIVKLALDRNKMVFLSGPRQCGKTTLAKSLLLNKNNYFNWDHVPFRKKWLLEQEEIATDLLNQDKPRLVLDEFHKNKKWKNQLKGFYDQYGDQIQLMITASSRLNTYRKGADSLLGRFVHFQLFPYSLGEVVNPLPCNFSDFIKFLNNPELNVQTVSVHRTIERLLKFGGFPEPFENQSEEFYQIWKKNRNELLIRQDVKDLSNIFDIGHVEILASFIPDRVGSPLSTSSLREDLDVAHTTVTRWLLALSQVYFLFDIRPFTKSIARSLKKEPKLYLYDWGDIDLPGPRFENMVACHLFKFVHFMNDIGEADLKLHYLRDKDQREVDFLITNKNKPLFSLEVKLKDTALDNTFRKFQNNLKVPHFQIINDKNIFRKHENQAYVISFDQFFSRTP